MNAPIQTANRDQPGAVLLALGVFCQAIGCLVLDRPPLRLCLSVSVIGLGLALSTFELWRNRMRLDHRVDMLVVMLALGGLGMLLGTAVDRTLSRAAPSHPASHAMDSMAMVHTVAHQHAVPAAPPAPGAKPMRRSWGQALTSWMTVLMLAGAIPPALRMTRCAALARTSPRRWVATHLFGNLGMVFGMIFVGRTFGHALGLTLGLPETGHHLAMLAGMGVGMVAAQFLAEAALGLRPWRQPAALSSLSFEPRPLKKGWTAASHK